MLRSSKHADASVVFILYRDIAVNQSDAPTDSSFEKDPFVPYLKLGSATGGEEQNELERPRL